MLIDRVCTSRLGESLEDALHALPVPVYIKDSRGVIRFVNNAVAAITGKTVESYLGKTNFDFVAQPDAESLQRDDERVLRGEKVTTDRNVHFDGRNYNFRVTKQLLRNTPYGDAIICCVH